MKLNIKISDFNMDTQEGLDEEWENSSLYDYVVGETKRRVRLERVDLAKNMGSLAEHMDEFIVHANSYRVPSILNKPSKRIARYVRALSSTGVNVRTDKVGVVFQFNLPTIIPTHLLLSGAKMEPSTPTILYRILPAEGFMGLITAGKNRVEDDIPALDSEIDPKLRSVANMAKEAARLSLIENIVTMIDPKAILSFLLTKSGDITVKQGLDELIDNLLKFASTPKIVPQDSPTIRAG